MTRLSNPTPQFLDNSGNVVVSGKLFFFKSQTSSELDTFADNILSIKNTNPVLLDASGRLPNVFFDGSAKIVLTGTVDIGGVPGVHKVAPAGTVNVGTVPAEPGKLVVNRQRARFAHQVRQGRWNKADVPFKSTVNVFAAGDSLRIAYDSSLQ